MSNLTAISISKHGVRGLYKSPSVNAHFGNKIAPILYFRKPKWVTDEQFESIIDDIASQIVGLNTRTVVELDKIEEEL